MSRLFVLAVFVLSVPALWAGEPADHGLAPLGAAEAEERAAETRDLLVDLLWEHTDVYWHSGRWDEAVRLCRQVTELDPQFVEPYTGAAWLLSSMDRDEEATAFYRAGIAANPDSYELYHEFGLYYFRRQKWEDAAEQFRKSVELQAPMYLQHMLPNALEQAGRKEDALAEWRALLERFPEDPIAKRHIEALEAELAGG